MQPESTPTSDSVARGEVTTVAPTDLGSLLQNSDNVQTLGAQRRSQIAFDPHIRGYRFGEIYTQSAGEYYLPVRLDLDSMLSKIDPYLMQNVTVIPGPYGLRYGPGFSFIDVQSMDTPRSNCGTQWNNRFSLLTRGNGSQILGSDTLSGGGQNYGFITNYGLRTGADYRAGNGQLIPSSYHSQNALLQLGWDTANGRVEARYNRLDMWNTEYALQFFDISSLRTDSFNLNYNGVDPTTGAAKPDAGLVQPNRLRRQQSERQQDRDSHPRRQRPEQRLQHPAVQCQLVPGLRQRPACLDRRRTVRTYGDENGDYTRLGADVRYVTQSTSERFHIADPATRS